jgi:hypothetical protein
VAETPLEVLATADLEELKQLEEVLTELDYGNSVGPHNSWRIYDLALFIQLC